MTTETTASPAHTSAPISVQEPALEALVSLAAQYPQLPAGYITVHSPHELRPGRLDLQMHAAHEFEAWREALEIPAADVKLHVTVGNCWVSADTQVGDATVEISGFGIQLSLKQLTELREVQEAGDAA